MTGERYKALIERFRKSGRMSQARMAELLGIGLRTSQGYAAGDPMPAPTDMLLELLESGKVKLADIERLAKKRAAQ